MIVGFFRHGPAVPHGTPGVEESQRPLTPEGREKTRRAARGVRRLDLGFDRVVTSPLPRAVQTAEILARALRLPRPKVSKRLLPGTPPGKLLGAIREAGGKSPVLVGHEPTQAAAVASLLGARDASALESKKAGLVVVEVLAAGSRPRGALLQFLSPATLRALAQ